MTDADTAREIAHKHTVGCYGGSERTPHNAECDALTADIVAACTAALQAMKQGGSDD